MTDKEFRRLSRLELIEIIYELQKREKSYEEKIARLEEELLEREIKLNKAGSIAEAALALNNVFEQAQAAADQYLEEIKRRLELAKNPEADVGGTKDDKETDT